MSNQISTIENSNIRTALYNSKLSKNCTKKIIYILHDIVNLLKNESSRPKINWQLFSEYFKKYNGNNLILEIIYQLLSCGCYEDVDKEPAKDILLQKTTRFGNIVYLLENNLSPINLIFTSLEPNANNYVSVKCVHSDCNSIFLHKLLHEYLSTYAKIYGDAVYFFSCFNGSLNNKIITSISDFNEHTFNTQIAYYKKKYSNNKRILLKCLMLLKSFYMMLLSSEEGSNIFASTNIDITMLKNPRFFQHYLDGYILTHLNPLDPIPIYNKWLLNPNGFENKTTKLNSSKYLVVNFDKILDSTMIYYSKHWFWHNDVNLSSRIDFYHIISFFINYIYDLKSKYGFNKFKNENNSSLFSIEEIFSYVSLIKEKSLNNKYITTISNFFKHISENNLGSITPECYRFLTVSSKKPQNTSASISDEDVIKIDKILKTHSEKNLTNALYYILFHILLSSELRASQVINANVNSLISPRKNTYYISSNTKVTNGDIVDIPISKYTYRLFETAISITSGIRETCSDSRVKDNIFIHDFYKNKVTILTLRSFSDNLKAICLNLSLNNYTAENLRDTYMTSSMKFAMENNLSLLQMKGLTWHKKLDTTNNHYVSLKVKEYLESTHMVIIDNFDVSGTVASEKSEICTNDNLVNNECGYCSSNDNDCNFISEIPCLMCDGFYSTVDRIPYFEREIAEIDSLIINAPTSHDKEHLYVKKQLYSAYLALLLTLEEENKNVSE
ncbi:hypothetical protein [Clostridium tertium]|uniref:hypothetical protein n=1 Tax=Clostridium tertium TaxID=1559 RepID=UPI00232ACB9F|nr:hypothetical protein [Clostridium tertium]MDB1940077.1 hypothetical protein [Clostridium tertium]